MFCNSWRLSGGSEGSGALRNAALHDRKVGVAACIWSGWPILCPDSIRVQVPLPVLPQRQHLLLANEDGVDPLPATLLYFVKCLRRLWLPTSVRLLCVGHVLRAQVPLASTKRVRPARIDLAVSRVLFECAFLLRMRGRSEM